MLCKKKSKGINAKTAAARARKAAMEAERQTRQAWEQAEVAWVASCPSPVKSSKAARRKEETLARRSQALTKKAENKKLAVEEQQNLELLYHTGRKQRNHTLNSSRPHADVLATVESTYSGRKKGASPHQLRIIGMQKEHLQLINRGMCDDDHVGFLETALAHLSMLNDTRPSIPIRPHRPSRKTLYQASLLCVDA